jgi:nitrite reductase/ring-hydroxylating ferredoxin subunit
MQWVPVAKASSLAPGAMREVSVYEAQDAKVLLVRLRSGELVATSSKCPHYDFSLARGVLHGDKIVCPFHNAAFCARTGTAA